MYQESAGLSFSPHLVLPFSSRSSSGWRFWAFRDHYILRYSYILDAFLSKFKPTVSRVLEQNLALTPT